MERGEHREITDKLAFGGQGKKENWQKREKQDVKREEE